MGMGVGRGKLICRSTGTGAPVSCAPIGPCDIGVLIVAGFVSSGTRSGAGTRVRGLFDVNVAVLVSFCSPTLLRGTRAPRRAYDVIL